MDDTSKRHGILVKLPADDPMAASHLLGEDWSSTRWFDTPQARDAALADMRRQPGNYRIGDTPSVELSPIER